MEDDKIDQLQTVTVKQLLDFFNGTSAVKENTPAKFAANLAVRALSAIGRIKATNRAMDATQFMVIKQIAENKKEFQKYISVSMPHLNPRLRIENK